MSGADRRTAVRVVRPMEIQYASNCPPINGRIEDISETGAFVDTNHPLEQGSFVHFRFFLPDETPEVPIQGRGKVAWTEPMVGFGLEFLELPKEVRERLKFFVASVFFGHLKES